VPVSAKLTAAIASMQVRDGSMVSKGQLLCALESDELTRQIDSARLALMQAQETLRRARETRANDAQRKSIALGISIPVIYITNLVRNVVVIHLYDVQNVNFELAHGFIGKMISLLTLVGC